MNNTFIEYQQITYRRPINHVTEVADAPATEATGIGAHVLTSANAPRVLADDADDFTAAGGGTADAQIQVPVRPNRHRCWLNEVRDHLAPRSQLVLHADVALALVRHDADQHATTSHLQRTRRILQHVQRALVV